MNQRDNSTFQQKLSLRKALLKEVDEPVILETHGGLGKLWQACYSHVPRGVVFEQDSTKAEVLAKQRPAWAVYEGDCVGALAAGAGAHLEINFVDVDPYGDPWPVIDAFFESKRPRAERLFLAVNDGLRQEVRLTGGWDAESMRPMVSKYGNRLNGIYLQVCEELLKEKAGKAGYDLTRFHGYYCGSKQCMTHYSAILSRVGGSN